MYRRRRQDETHEQHRVALKAENEALKYRLAGTFTYKDHTGKERTVNHRCYTKTVNTITRHLNSRYMNEK